MSKTIIHGTRSTYSYYKCRCDLCKEASNTYHREHRTANHQSISEYKREWDLANQDKVKKYCRESQQKRRKMIQDIKVESGCIDCGYNLHPDALEFDHIDPSAKLFAISAGASSRSVESILREIDKCEVRCANCHRIRTAKQRADRKKCEMIATQCAILQGQFNASQLSDNSMST